MNFNLERREIKEASKQHIDSDQLSETEQTAENFDNCGLNEVQDNINSEVSSESLEEAEENYEDCAAKIEESKETNKESSEADEDFDDCGKEFNGQYAAGVTYATDGEISREEARREIHDAYHKCDDPEDMHQLKENANENEHIEVHDAEVIDRPENNKMTDDLTQEKYTEAQDKLDEARDNLVEQQEAAQEYQADLENQMTEHEDKVPEGTEYINSEVNPSSEEIDKTADAFETTEDSEELSEDTKGSEEINRKEISQEVEININPELNREEKHQITEDAAESVKEVYYDAAKEVSVEGKIEVAAEAIETKEAWQNAADAGEETSDGENIENSKKEFEYSEKTLQERINSTLEKEDVTPAEINHLRRENSEEIAKAKAEKSAAESQLSTMFSDVLEKEKGSDEYYQSLQMYNAVQDKKRDLDEHLATMEKQQDYLDEKYHGLRDAQIKLGLESIAASGTTLAAADMLQERFDQSYYDGKKNEKEFSAIRDESRSVIIALSDEKDSIKQAMDAKMDQISEYVVSNHLSHYDTSHDPHYQKLSAEYNKMKEQYHIIDYNIVKLDENNKAVSKQLGVEYISMVEVPRGSMLSEVKNGTDIPGSTNYFINEVKAAEVLSPFKQNNWEHLTLQEQKKATERLADYNAEILGIEDKPRIIFYNEENPSRFGGYSAQQNAIYINEYNMKDAAETADTISHECRHKYQHARAEKLETERDLIFKEGFDNYIRAEDDYQAYKDQPVEADARAYAKVVKEKISSYSDCNVDNSHQKVEQVSFGSDYAKFNPEKGTVFKNTSMDELADDLEQKEQLKYREVLETKELDELRNSARIHYENGKQLANRIPEFNNYKEHHDIENGHIEKVRVKSLEAANALETHFCLDNYDGLYADHIDRKAIEVMAIYHDTGMDGNIRADDYDAERALFLSDESKRKKFIADAIEEKEKDAAKRGIDFDRAAEEQKANERFDREGFEAHFRPNHSLESAIHVLRDRDHISTLGVNPDEVALGCLVHSKSNSGLKNIAIEKEWKVAIDRLQDRVGEFNRTHPDEQIQFDNSFLLNRDGSFVQDKLAEMRSEAIALRIGDANGHDTNSRTSQNGKVIEFSLENKPELNNLPNDYKNKFENGEYESYFSEVQSADVKIGGVKLNNTNDPKGISRMFAVGEGNFHSLSCNLDDSGVIRQNFELCNGNAFPLSTQHCIKERIGEFKTADPMNYIFVVKLGNNCSKEVYKSYCAFSDSMNRNNNVRVEIVR